MSRRVTAAAASAAAARMAERRARADDPDLAQLSDDLMGVLGHLRSHQRVPAEVLRADVADALQIVKHLRSELDRLQLAAIRAGLAAGMSYRDLARPLGVTTRQGVEAALRRLENAVAGGPKDERVVRAARKRRQREAHWLAEHSVELRGLASILIAHQDQLPAVVAEDIDDIADKLESIPAGALVSPGFAAQLRLILRDLESSGGGVPSKLKSTLERAAVLLASDSRRHQPA